MFVPTGRLQRTPGAVDRGSMSHPSVVLHGDILSDGVLESLPDAAAVVDASGTIVAVNRAWRMFCLDNGGSPEATGAGVNYLEVCRRAAAAGCPEASEVSVGLDAVLTGETVESDHEYPCPSPTVGRWFTSRIVPLGDGSGGALVSHLNITRRRASERQLEYRATHDPLTGLANRLLFTDRLSDALHQQPDRCRVTDVGLVVIDLDRFEEVNDTFGHDAGDEVLAEAAFALRSEVRAEDTVARLGGDEFAVSAPGSPSKSSRTSSADWGRHSTDPTGSTAARSGSGGAWDRTWPPPVSRPGRHSGWPTTRWSRPSGAGPGRPPSPWWSAAPERPPPLGRHPHQHLGAVGPGHQGR